MPNWLEILLGVLGGILASSGFWGYLQMRFSRDDAEREMIKGLGHDRITELGKKYIANGYITPAEYENLNDYLYQPYKRLKGNGSADRIMSEVDRLPMKSGEKDDK